MTPALLLITKGESNLRDQIPREYPVHQTALEHAGEIDSLAGGPALILFDLDREPDLADRLLILEEYQPLRETPRWGILSSRDVKTANLFLAWGGSRLLGADEMVAALGEITPREKPLQPGDDDLSLALSLQAESRRVADSLKFADLNKRITRVCRATTSLPGTMEYLLDQIFLMVRPHLGLFLVNNSQKVECYAKPDTMIFAEDHQDFMNFCLNDFFTHFQGVNLEDISETLFLKDREDFQKISLGRQKISSYVYFPIHNRAGQVEATLHLGHLRNDYFSDRMIGRVTRMIKTMEGSFSYALRLHQITLKQDKLLNIFSRFVPAEIIPQLIIKESQKDSAAAEERTITVLFSDIRSFTTITEKNSAQDVVDFLNRHFNVMVGIIKNHGGTIDKFIGDAIVALFGVPQSFEDNSTRALRAAVEMSQALPRVDCTGLILDGSHYSIGIGLHQGPAIIGNVGSEEKADYTAIGDVIGIAEELEAMTKKYQVLVLASEAVAKAAGGAVPLKALDTLALGKEGEMTVYTPVGEASHG